MKVKKKRVYQLAVSDDYGQYHIESDISSVGTCPVHEYEFELTDLYGNFTYTHIQFNQN